MADDQKAPAEKNETYKHEARHQLTPIMLIP